SNGSSNGSYTSFLLLGLPGLREAHDLLVLPFLSFYLVIISANVLVIHTVAAQRSLHQPMYLLIALLLAVNICVATTVVPAILFSFSTHFNRISLPRCLLQMFCVYFLVVFDCNILMVMALDRCVVILYPLRYSEIVMGQLLAGLVGAAAARSTCIVDPVVALASRVHTSAFNISYTNFFLVGFPGLREWRPLLLLPLTFLYVMIISANALVIHTVMAQRSLHQPMYMLIALLLAVNICAATAVMPKMLEGFVHYTNPMSLRGCLAQMFFIYFTLLLDYNLLLAMALDRYVAICHPLRYTDLLTSRLLHVLAILALTRSLGVAVPLVVLTSRARFCQTMVIRHFACEYIALLSIACGDLTFNNRLGLAMRLVTVIFDLALLGTSYTRIIYAAFRISSKG
ncbi:O52B4 protein, partial [Crocuta crocuta]